MDTKQILHARQWQHYLTRPFSILGASLWQEWYCSDVIFGILGIRCSDVYFIEETKDVVRCYRPQEQIEQLNIAVKQVLFDTPKSLQLFQEARNLNKRAQRILSKKEKSNSFQEAVDFFIHLSVIATVIPFRMGVWFDIKEKPDTEVTIQAEELRKLSYYPQILEEIVIPLAKKECIYAEYLTYKELCKKEYVVAKERIGNQGFVYAVIDGKEEISFTQNVNALIQQLEPLSDTAEVKGRCAYPGKITGKVRIINQRTLQGVKFNKGDILISVSTSPIYLPFMQIAGAIIADEGGFTSHAAILSRELKKPCIIGTKIATRVFKDGDVVEVDADKGIVKKVS